MIEIVKSTPIGEYAEDDGLEAFAVFDSGVYCGTILFYIKKDKLNVLDIKIFKEIDGLDLNDVLLRAAASYALEHGAAKAVIKNKELAGKLLSLGFEENEKGISAALEDILKKQCKHGEENDQ